MPVFSLDESCWNVGVVFPDMRNTDVGRAFDVVGGVARAIFDLYQLEILKQQVV